MESVESLTEDRIKHLENMSNCFGIEFLRVRALALALGKYEDRGKLLDVLNFIKCKES